MQATRKSFSMKKNKQPEIHPHNEILGSSNKKWAIKPQKDMDESLMKRSMWKKLVWKSYILYNYNYMTLNKGKTRDMVIRLMVARGYRWGMLNR